MGGIYPVSRPTKELARIIGSNLRGQAEIVVRPVAAEVVVSRAGTEAEQFLRTRIEQIRVIDGRTGKLLHRAAYPRFEGQIERTFREPEPENFQGVDPYTVEVRGLRLGISEKEAVAIVEDTFGDVRYMSDRPSMIRAFGQNGERIAIILDMDRNVKALNYTLTWQDEVAEQVRDATITRFRRPERMSDLRLDPMTRADKKANFAWTTNADRIGGFTGRVWYWSSQKETKIYLDFEDRRKPTFEAPKPLISLD